MDEKTFKVLGKRLKLQQQGFELDERWDRLTAGELTPEEEEELRTLAASSPEASLAFEAFQPLGRDFDERLLDQTMARLRSTPSEAPHRRRFWKRFSFWVPLTAAAAAASILLLPAAPAQLRQYSLELSSGVQSLRGSEVGTGEVPTFVPGSTLTLTLRPDEPELGPVAVRVYYEQGGRLAPLAIPAEGSPNGSIRLRGIVGQDVALPTGEVVLWIAVGRETDLPSPAVLRHAPQSGAFQRFETRIRFQDAPP